MTDSLTLHAAYPRTQPVAGQVPGLPRLARSPVADPSVAARTAHREADTSAAERRSGEYLLGTPAGGRVVVLGLVGWFGVAGWVVTASLLVGLLVVALAVVALGLTLLAL